MKPVVKGLVIGCVVLVFLAIVAIAAGVWYVRENKDRFMAAGQKVRAEGQEHGKTSTEDGCVTAALARYEDDRSLTGQITARVWLTGCLETAPRDPAFCASVPPKNELTRTITWRLRECKRLGFEDDSACPNILNAVQDHCARPSR